MDGIVVILPVNIYEGSAYNIVWRIAKGLIPMAEKILFWGEVKSGEVISHEGASLSQMLQEKMEGKMVKVGVEEMKYEGPDYDEISLNNMLKMLKGMKKEEQ